MKEENLLSTVVSEVSSPETAPSSTGDDVQRHWQGVVKRRSFLKGLGMAGATLSASSPRTRFNAGFNCSGPPRVHCYHSPL